MATSTYYYPYQNGGSAAVPGATPNYNGVQSFTVQGQQTSGYIKVIADSATPNQYQVTFNYGTNNPLTETVYQTRYSSANFNEVTDGYYNYLLSNSALATGQTYAINDTGNNGSTQFQPNSAYATDPTACYVTGTLIKTASGDVAVEGLRAGDVVVTASGEHRAIRWIGSRAYSGIFARRNPDVMPIRFAAGSLGDQVPSRDLVVSPKHAMVLDGALIPAEVLVNGRTITRAQSIESVEYFHVELDSHDVLIAEGAASESYVDDDNRSMFHNAAEHRAANPDAVRVEAIYCLPRVEDGFALEAVRRRLAARADVLLGTAAAGIAA